MTKAQLLDLIEILSALESWSFSTGNKQPAYLIERINTAIEALRQEVLK